MGHGIFDRAVRRRSHASVAAKHSPRPRTADDLDLYERFERIAPFTLGAEEEFLLVDPETLALVPLAEHALAIAEGDRRVSREFRASQLEGVTPICITVSEVERELVSVRSLLASRLGDSPWLVASGTHPLTHDPGPVSSGERYRAIADANPWAARHMLTCGLHVHVAVGGVDRTLAVYNALRTYLPEIIALGANAPFYRGEDSGLATVRPKLNGFAPRSGLPPAFATWQELADFTRWAQGGGEVPDQSHHWWDIRLNARHATLEVRAADAQTRVEDAAALTALIQSLVVELVARYEAGEELPVARSERIAENMWLAARDGVHGWLIDPESGKRVRTADRLQALIGELQASARSVGCEPELLNAATLAEDGGGASRQRRVYQEGGRRSLIAGLAQETAGAAAELTWARQPNAGAELNPRRSRPKAARHNPAVSSWGLEVVTP